MDAAYKHTRRDHWNCRVAMGTRGAETERHPFDASSDGLRVERADLGGVVHPQKSAAAERRNRGDDIATTKVITDVVPASDGTIHVDFATSEAFVNAIEILQGAPHRMLPARVVVGHSPYRDSSGNVWMPDRYFFGGRLSSFAVIYPKSPMVVFTNGIVSGTSITSCLLRQAVDIL
jgi:hypothetical protein